MALIPPVINSNTFTSDLSWLQEGYTYGIGDSGPWQRFKRRGLNPSIENWYNILVNAGWIVTVTRDKVDNNSNDGHATIEASCGWAFPYLYGIETPENIWELDPQDEQKALLDADYPNGSINLTSKLTREMVTQMVDDPSALWAPAGTTLNPSPYNFAVSNNNSYAFDDGANNWNIPPIVTANPIMAGPFLFAYPTFAKSNIVVKSLPSDDYDPAYSLYLMLKAGIENFPLEASIIRHTMLTSNLYAIQASFINQGRIISSPSMYSVESVPSTLLFAVPSLPTPAQYIETAGDLQYGWRKIRPHVARLNRMKWRLTQNYVFGLWPVKLFGTVL